MTVIAFWNTQRLGRNTDPARAHVLTTLAAQRNPRPDLNLFCELTTRSQFPQAQNLTYRVQRPMQLCYGALVPQPANAQQLINQPLTRETPIAGPNYPNTFPGGNDFRQLANRALAWAGRYGGVDVYVFHAPAVPNQALRAMAYLASALDPSPNPWILVGDFNVTPAVLGPTNVLGPANGPGLPVWHVIEHAGVATHFSRTGVGSELDYALSIRQLNVGALRQTRWGRISDHSPIFIQY